jgi:hypothetical protein
MAAAKKGLIFADPRYEEFVDRYHADPLRFAVEVTGLIPSSDQEELLTEISVKNAKVSVVSGTSTGKTAAFGRIALWHMHCHPIAVYDEKIEIGSNTYIKRKFNLKTILSGFKCISVITKGNWRTNYQGTLS